MDENIRIILQYIIPPLITGIIGLIAGINIQKKKNRPEITTHGCRVSGEQVYTYFNSDNNPSDPVCPYLAKDGSKDCNFDINTQSFPPKSTGKLRLDKCYIALWGGTVWGEQKKKKK